MQGYRATDCKPDQIQLAAKHPALSSAKAAETSWTVQSSPTRQTKKQTLHVRVPALNTCAQHNREGKLKHNQHSSFCSTHKHELQLTPSISCRRCCCHYCCRPRSIKQAGSCQHHHLLLLPLLILSGSNNSRQQPEIKRSKAETSANSRTVAAAVNAAPMFVKLVCTSSITHPEPNDQRLRPVRTAAGWMS